MKRMGEVGALCGIFGALLVGTTWLVVTVSSMIAGMIDNAVSPKSQADVVIEETMVYGRDGKTSKIRLQEWESSGAAFVRLDIPLDSDVQEYMYYLCQAYDIDYAFVLGLIDAESGFQANVISNTGDIGLMQINQVNAQALSDALGVDDLEDPYQNIRAGLYVLRTLFERYKLTEEVCMAYNMGEKGARRLWAAGVTSTKYSDAVLQKRTEYGKKLAEARQKRGG